MAKQTPIVSLGCISNEDLPLPWVRYPQHYGTFFAFGNNKKEQLYLCECNRPLIYNYLQLVASKPISQYLDPLRTAPLHSLHFPINIASLSLKSLESPMRYLRFRPQLCHRCNLKKPSFTYCHEMYGGKFTQGYGWYINQCYFRLGILPRSFDFLPSICPSDFQKFIEEINEARKQMSVNLSRLTRCLSREVENITRKEFGLRKVGEGRVAEKILLNIVKSIFPSENIFFHYRPFWLEKLEIDIFVPSLSLAIEYQGQQHYHSVKAWGGDDALKVLRSRDVKKKKLCRKMGIHLIEVSFWEPLTKEFVEARIKETLPNI